MATINLGAIKFNWKGAYNSGTSYAVDDVVSSGGNSYVCIQAHTTAQAVGNATAYWNIMSSKGTNGTDADLLNISSTAQGDLYYNSGSAIARLAKGTAGQVLKINSGATAPEWGTDVGGKIGQVVSTLNSYGQSVSSTSMTDVESASGTVWESAITPVATSSKILVMCSIYLRNHRTSGSENRNNVEIHQKIGSGNYSLLERGYEMGHYQYDGNGAIVGVTWNPKILISPNTTDEVKFKFKIGTQDSNSQITMVWGSGGDAQKNRVVMMEVLA